MRTPLNAGSAARNRRRDAALADAFGRAGDGSAFCRAAARLGCGCGGAGDDFGFLTRLYNAYADEWGMASAPAEPNAPASRRPAPFPPQPENSPPYPFTEWPVGGLNPIGASLPNAVDSPLMKAIGPSPLGKTLEDSHIQIRR